MTSWYTSWLPTFPTINIPLPSDIQRRFVTFVLKKSLGHLLKPGQLDVHQIDSQIGSGFVQVKDLQLDNEAINQLTPGLPIQLHEGSVSSVIVRVPWPNPLTSTVGLSLHSLHLTFHLHPSTSNNPSHSSSNLADSVASVAESFLHKELSPREEAILRESFHPDLVSSRIDGENSVPGSFDPFSSSADEDFHPDADPAGVSMFASLIEHLLSRFEFDAVDTKLTFLYPGNSSFTISIPEIRYGRETRNIDVNTDNKTLDRGESSVGETGTVFISGVTVTARNLQRQIFLPSSPATLSPVSPTVPSHLTPPPRSPSPASSSSSLNEDTQFLMSQSIACLPPQEAPSLISAPSNLHQVVSNEPILVDAPHKIQPLGTGDQVEANFSDTRTSGSLPNPNPELDDDATRKDVEPAEEMILSFGPEPVIIRFTIPPYPSSQTSSSDTDPSVAPNTDEPHAQGEEKLQLSLTTGLLSCALYAWHVRCLIDILDILTPHNSSRTSSTLAPDLLDPAGSPTSVMGPDVEGSVRARGVVLILLSSTPWDRTCGISASNMDEPLADFFAHPLVPPRLIEGYVRTHVENISLSLVLNSSAPVRNAAQERPSQTRNEASTTNQTAKTLMLSISDLSVIAIHAKSTPSHEVTMYASPILITDHHLPSQYPPNHVHIDSATFTSEESHSRSYPQLPTFDLIDWTDEKHQKRGMKLSTWRSRFKPQRGHEARQGSLDEPPKSRPGAEPPIKSVTVSSEPNAQSIPQTPNPPAVCASAKVVISLATGKKVPNKITQLVELKTVPLHLFVDLGLALNPNGLLSFLDQVVGSRGDLGGGKVRANEESSLESTSEEEYHKPAAVPSVMDVREREKERRRLEKLVLKDLDLDFDYRKQGAVQKTRRSGRKRTSSKETVSNVSIKLPMMRIQIRTPTPSSSMRRSGALVFDLHDITWSIGSTTFKKSVARFVRSNISSSSALWSAECRRIVIGCSPAGDGKATAVISLGPLLSDQEVSGRTQHVSEPDGNDLPQSLKPRIALIGLNHPQSQSSEPVTNSTARALTVDVPSVNVQLSKALLDDLQYWADNVTQLVERTFNDGGSDTEKADSRDTSLIGSRYFARSRRSDSDNGSTHQIVGQEMIIEIAISEASTRLMLGRLNEGSSTVVRPLDIFASDVDASLELRPAGKDETIFTLAMMDLNVSDTASGGKVIPLISLTTARSLSSSPKPLLKLRFTSLLVPETTVKESRIKLSLQGFTYNITPDFGLITDITRFLEAPPGTFESVIPSERTSISLTVVDGSTHISVPPHSGVAIFYIGELGFWTDIVGGSPENRFRLSAPAISLLFLDDLAASDTRVEVPRSSLISEGLSHWKTLGFALFVEIADLDMNFKSTNLMEPTSTEVVIDRIDLRLHLCADTMTPVTLFAGHLSNTFSPPDKEQLPNARRQPAIITEQLPSQPSVLASVDEHAFKSAPEIGPTIDMIHDDLPTNLDYLDESFGTAAGLRELRDDDLEEFDIEETEVGGSPPGTLQTGVVSRIGGETIKVLDPEGLHIVEDYFATLPPESSDGNKELGETTLSIRVHDCDVTIFLYDGYDWSKTRKTIENEVKEMRRRLAKIRQLVATGQTQDPSIEETSTLLFNSVYIGLEQNVDDLDPSALIAAIDEELNDNYDATSQSSWQPLKPPSNEKTRTRSTRIHGKRLTRSRGPSMEFRFSGVDAEIDHYWPDQTLLSRTLATIKDVEILDHIKTSTWQKFLTELRTDSRGNIRETGSNMVRVELRNVRPVPGHPSEEARLRAKILPLRLYVDQDALDFLKRFFSFKDPHVEPTSSKESSEGEIYFQLAEIFPVDLKLDYKPRRVDYRALREGRTIELMNFFHFDGAEMTLRHITLSGITGWPRLFEMLNDLWTPDVKATQLMEVISGVSPIRSVVNVGSGFADLVLLPIAQYKKDGRIVRGVQKGTTAFVKSTAMEAIKLGARLATGTQVILEQAEGVLGGQFQHPITMEALQVPPLGGEYIQHPEDEEEAADLISRYAEQPVDITEGVQTAYRSLQRNFNSAAQTILAVPMEVYERSGSEGPVRAVIRAVPIAVLKPMIGVSEAVGKTLLGFRNTLDPDIRHEAEAKYKHR